MKKPLNVKLVEKLRSVMKNISENDKATPSEILQSSQILFLEQIDIHLREIIKLLKK